MAIQGYFLGCPIWSHRPWVGEFFLPGTRPSQFLREYARVFNAVEGNSTFYAVPAVEQLRRWRDDTPEGFRFCFKFPRRISHWKRLRNCENEVEHFLGALRAIADRLGPIFLQLPSTFGAESLDALLRFLESLPPEFQYAVELRSPDYYRHDAVEQTLVEFLTERRIDRVVFDTRALHASAATDEATAEAKARKPAPRFRLAATGPHPFVRFIGDPEIARNLPLLETWADIVGNWIEEGRIPFVFMHAADDFYAPRMARLFHQILAKKCPQVGDMPPWPVEQGREGEQLPLL